MIPQFYNHTSRSLSPYARFPLMYSHSLEDTIQVHGEPP